MKGMNFCTWGMRLVWAEVRFWWAPNEPLKRTLTHARFGLWFSGLLAASQNQPPLKLSVDNISASVKEIRILENENKWDLYTGQKGGYFHLHIPAQVGVYVFSSSPQEISCPSPHRWLSLMPRWWVNPTLKVGWVSSRRRVMTSKVL